MPYIIIHVEDEEDVKRIIFNDDHGNAQVIVDSGSKEVPFEFIARTTEDYAESTR